MGFANRRPILPAPTDSLLESADDTGLGTDVATDLSRRTDRTSHTIPADGSPITITTAQKRSAIGKLVKTGNQSHTSLLIEYFEGGPGSERQPSVRVKVTPSASRKSKDRGDGHLLFTETQGTRTLSQSHRIPLFQGHSEQILDDSSISALDSEVRFKRPAAPVEIEVAHNQGSEVSGLSASPEARFIVPESDISSMPGDSLLGTSHTAAMAHQPRSGSLARSEEVETEMLKPPVMPAGRNLSNERITQKVIEKLSNKPRVASGGKRHHGDKTHSRSGASREVDLVREPRKRSAKHVEDESMTTATGSSLVSGSLLSADPPKSVDQRSNLSATSNVSINNPRLLQTVEDAIRRLILPELKELKKGNRNASHHTRYEKDLLPSDISESSISREETTHRRVSDGKSRRHSGKGGDVVSSGSRRRERRHKTTDYDSPSEQSYRNSESVESISVDDDRRTRKHHKDHRLRDAAAGAIAGGVLTAAALKHHDSGSSLDRRERRKKRSKSRSSRSASIAESEEIFHKHDVPPMPMRSEVGSELTRSSLLSSNTAGTATPVHREVREVVRGSPRELTSPRTQTPSKTPVDKTPLSIKRALGTHHGNFSEQDLATHREGDYEVTDENHDTYDSGFNGLDHTFLTDPERARAYERNLHHQHPIRRGLSPIQSVASYATTEPNRNSMLHPRSVDSIGSLKKEQQLRNEISVASMSSSTSTDLAKSNRPHGISLENRSEIMGQHQGATGEPTRALDEDDFFDEQHYQNDQYRNSYASSGPKIPLQHMSNYTDDSMDAPYLDEVTAGQQLARGYGANPEYVDTPPGVESAVASLCDPSVLDLRKLESPRLNQEGSFEQHEYASPRPEPRDLVYRQTGSPLKQKSYHNVENMTKAVPFSGPSPPQSVTQSEDEKVHRSENVPPATNPVRNSLALTSEGQAAESPESEITTNPSVIHGPIGGLAQGSRDHWPYDPTPPRSKADVAFSGTNRAPEAVGADLVPEALSITRASGFDTKREAFANDAKNLTPPGVKDEGYETGAHAPSPALYPREQAIPEPMPFSPVLGLGDNVDEEDPFTTKNRAQYISGFSQGMSPLYDSATGRGIDRIQSKDIVALMDHLTVRDAQRNARDTEILVTLVRSAAEMRNSFEDMKKFIAEQDDMIMDTADKQHERTQKVVGGPRPQPQPVAASRLPRTPASEEEDLPAKRKNVFKRALRGLGAKNTQELQNIEVMLVQLLDNVEGLRALQGGSAGHNEPRAISFNSNEHVRAPTDPGYEPEGQAGTSSTGDHSAIFSNNSSRQADYRGVANRQTSGNRVSTVMEGDEEYDEYDHNAQGAVIDPQRTPRATPTRGLEFGTARGSSVPLETPPRMHEANHASLSNENTPQMSTEGASSRKHKSFASSFLPKMVSRWSKTTASSGGENYRASTQTRQRPYSQLSHSGSNLGEYEYDPHGEDRLRSNTSFENDQYDGQENRPPSPLIPSQVSDNPKYQAVRNSVNLQHPQPRQGPTGRFQHHLESEAQYYTNDPTSPTSQTSSQWDNQAALSGMPGAIPNAAYAHGGHLSPISDGGYSETSAAMMNRDKPQSVRSNRSASSLGKGPPRPAKVLDEEPLVPQRPPKTIMSPNGSRQANYVDHVAAARAGSPAYDKSPVTAVRSSPSQSRKPSGPRPLSTSGQYSKGQKGDMNMIKKTRFRGSPNQIDSDDNVVY